MVSLVPAFGLEVLGPKDNLVLEDPARSGPESRGLTAVTRAALRQPQFHEGAP